MTIIMINKIKACIPENLKRTYHIICFQLASILYGFPQRKMKLIGITGTSGKSTTCAMLYHLLNWAHFRVGIISTVSAKYGKKEIGTGFHVTTPDPIQLVKILSIMNRKGAEYVIIECSSHGLEQGRLGNLQFDLAVYTNITKDHLDWHKTWENYARAKARLIEMTKTTGIVILNKDDTKGYKYLVNFMTKLTLKPTAITYSKSDITQVTCKNAMLHFDYDNVHFNIPVIGEYNCYNALAAVYAAKYYNIQTSKAAIGFQTFEGISGRMQVMQRAPFVIIVDFAHNADSLEKSLIEAKKIILNNSRLICIFGSAGLRDVEKRAEMGKISAKYADITIITAEDPRTEKLAAINDQILKGASTLQTTLVNRFADHSNFINYKIPKVLASKAVFCFDEDSVASRYDAVTLALMLAHPNDVIIIEGKGHEQSLCFGKTEYPFTDQNAVIIAQKLITNLNK
jgi:UDP-N-acetylmuramoyl-L-alanyl-D-glutamate--2,6-diaminopimelate ligase